MKSSVIKAAILGMGNMGRVHSNNLNRIEGVELAAFCSNHADSTRQYVAENNLQAPVYEDFYKMLDEVEFDVLYVCLPPFCHDGQIEAAASRGINIFVEKPLALTVERGESMAEAVRTNKVKSQVGYHMRFGSAVRRFAELAAEGRCGIPTLYSARYECNSLHAPWWRDVNKCGGQVFEQVIHLYDMALYLMGSPESISGYTGNLCHQDTPGYTVEDTSAAAIRFKSGALGSITGSNCAVPGQWNGLFRIVCGQMVADFKNHNEATFIYTEGDQLREEKISGNSDPYLEEDLYFIKVLQGKEPEFATIAEGLTGLKMVRAVVESSKNRGNPVLL